MKGQRARLHSDPRRAGPQPQEHLAFDIPHNQLTVITGVSGSGKSSLAFDTIYAEGQRRYVESLSAYARQFLERMEKPDVDDIVGIAPAVAIRRRTPRAIRARPSRPRPSCFDFLRLLFARVGRTFCPTLRHARPQRTRSTRSPRGCCNCLRDRAGTPSSRRASRRHADPPRPPVRAPQKGLQPPLPGRTHSSSSPLPNRCSTSTSPSRYSPWSTASRSRPTCTSASSTPWRSATAKQAR